MIGYRFLSPAEDEMSEATLFYDEASAGLGNDFLDDVQQAIDKLCEYPKAGTEDRAPPERYAAEPLSI